MSHDHAALKAKASAMVFALCGGEDFTGLNLSELDALVLESFAGTEVRRAQGPQGEGSA
jgi:hypothetical protein